MHNGSRPAVFNTQFCKISNIQDDTKISNEK